MDDNMYEKLTTTFFSMFLASMAITTIAQLTIMLVIVFADISGKELLIGASIVSVTFFGAFGSFRMLSNIGNLIQDMSDKLGSTTYGADAKSVPVAVLRLVFPIIILIVGIIQFTYVI